jgi:hypothetical protein
MLTYTLVGFEPISSVPQADDCYVFIYVILHSKPPTMPLICMYLKGKIQFHPKQRIKINVKIF